MRQQDATYQLLHIGTLLLITEIIIFQVQGAEVTRYILPDERPEEMLDFR